jgi:hypothetical protein
MSDTAQKNPGTTQPQAAQKKPNDTGSISVQAHLKIFDPKTNQTYVEGRG